MNACNRFIHWGILFLIFFTPLAFGSVHPWAFSLMEAVVFLLVFVWAGKVLLSSRFDTLILPPFFLPLAVFLAYICFQLLPLPPALLLHLSPSTHELYSHSLPGWPQTQPYSEIISFSQEENNGSGEPLRPNSQLLAPSSSLSAVAGTWRPLSLAPSLTYTSLLKWIAYASLFALVLQYPFGSTREAHLRFLRSLVSLLFGTACFLAALGIVQQWTWNGKFLWFFVPYDWNGPGSLDTPRASGPFINPDHFANYLAVIFPLTLAGAFFPGHFIARRFVRPFRYFCVSTAVLLIAAILLSLSRGGWIGLTVSALLMLGVFPLYLSFPNAQWLNTKLVVTRHAFVGIAALLFVALLCIGPTARDRVDLRLAETVEQDDSLQGRVAAWQDTVFMVRDFPFFGVGLGAWQDIFPRYQRPPWTPDYYSEAHNDYIEILAETGVIGCGLLLWAACLIMRILMQGVSRIPIDIRPYYAALLTGLVVIGVHELLDFSLQIPANAVLCTVLLAVALRLGMLETASDSESKASDFSVRTDARTPSARNGSLWQFPVRTSGVALGAVGVATLLLLLALQQERRPYPDRLGRPHSFAEARERILAHPARADSHVELYLLLRKSEAAPESLQLALTRALWLAPNDPYARDRYSALLRNAGHEDEGLQELTQSMTVAPVMWAHSVLDSEERTKLSQQESGAIEKGFQQAVALNYISSVPGLSSLYAALGRFADEAQLYEDGARHAENSAEQLQYLFNASEAYLRAKQLDRAEAVLQQAIAIAPQDARAYRQLATRVLAPQEHFEQAKRLLEEGIAQGVEPFTLTVALADAAQVANNSAEVKSALLQALDLQPASFDMQLRLGLLYLQERSYDRAALIFRKALDIKPDSATAFYHLGKAEEGRYQLFAADKAYARALELDPKNTGLRRYYEAFQKATRKEQGAKS